MKNHPTHSQINMLLTHFKDPGNEYMIRRESVWDPNGSSTGYAHYPRNQNLTMLLDQYAWERMEEALNNSLLSDDIDGWRIEFQPDIHHRSEPRRLVDLIHGPTTRNDITGLIASARTHRIALIITVRHPSKDTSRWEKR